MPSSISFEHASQELLNAAVDPARWPAAMDLLARFSNSTGSVILPVKGSSPGIPRSASMAECLDTYFREGWNLRDERYRGLPLITTKGIFVDQDFASKDEIETSDYYRGFLAKFDGNWSAVVGFTDPEQEWCLVFERGDKQGFFDEREQANLVRFAAPLHQAAALARSIAYTNAGAALDAYQSIGSASFLINQFGRVMRHNEEAEKLLGDGLELSRGYLRAVNVADNSTLIDLIAAQQYVTMVGYRADQIAVVHRPTKRPLVIRAIPLTGLASSVFSDAKTILLVSDIDKRPRPASRHALIKVFGLTATEAALVANLGQDIPLTDAAELMNISFETARTHLKHALSKTQTRRQQDLLLLIRRLGG